MQIRIKTLHPDAVVPQYATEQAAGFDLVAVEDTIIPPGHTALVKTGLAFELPEGYELQIRQRGGISLKTKMRVANSPGTIDADYRGEVSVIIDNIDGLGNGTFDNRSLTRNMESIPVTPRPQRVIDGTYIIRKGDRIAQGVIAPVVKASFQVVEELTNTSRGEGGFGHTGVKA